MELKTVYGENKMQSFALWDIQVKDKSATARLSEGRKLRDNVWDNNLVQYGIANANGYIDTNWSYVSFVGEAFKKVQTLQNGDRIACVRMNLNKEPYYGDTSRAINDAISLLEHNNVIAVGTIPRRQPVFGKVYPNHPSMTIYDFELAKDMAEKVVAQRNVTNMDSAPTVVTATTASVQPTVVIPPVTPAPVNYQTTQQVPTPSVPFREETEDDMPF